MVADNLPTFLQQLLISQFISSPGDICEQNVQVDNLTHPQPEVTCPEPVLLCRGSTSAHS
jgi:hypothetical protein